MLWFAAFFIVLLVYIRKVFAVPSELRHLPRVPIFPLLWSYLTVEIENRRLERLLLPFANRGDGLVVVWALGRWMVHVLDYTLARQMLENPELFPKELPPDDLLLWKFIGRSNILLQNGEGWKKHSRVVRGALNQSLPIDQFAQLSKKLFAKIGDCSVVRFDALAQSFALDAVGSTVLGHDFNAIEHESAFVQEYNGVMRGIANPLYLIMPYLERWLPRRALLQRMNDLAQAFQALLKEKMTNPGEDMMTYMLKEPDMSEEENRDNMVLLFIAGHDTSAGGLSTLVYYLAKHPEMQQWAREEVLSVMGGESEPTVELLQRMPYVNSCIREALRINTPISYVVPRSSQATTQLGTYCIPANTSLIANIFVIHHNESNWPSPFSFNPERFLSPRAGGDDAWIPFALGPRQCPARNFALYEQRVLTAMLLSKYKWLLPPNSVHSDRIQNAFSPFALSVPHDLDIKFERLHGKYSV